MRPPVNNGTEVFGSTQRGTGPRGGRGRQRINKPMENVCLRWTPGPGPPCPWNGVPWWYRPSRGTRQPLKAKIYQHAASQAHGSGGTSSQRPGGGGARKAGTPVRTSCVLYDPDAALRITAMCKHGPGSVILTWRCHVLPNHADFGFCAEGTWVNT